MTEYNIVDCDRCFGAGHVKSSLPEFDITYICPKCLGIRIVLQQGHDPTIITCGKQPFPLAKD